MQIFVCVKQVLDWNRSNKDFRIDPVSHEAAISFARYRVDLFDEIAVEIALQLRLRCGGTIRALSVGSGSAEDMLKHVLSMKADAATLVVATVTPVNTAKLLSAAIRKHGGADIILCGRVSSDNGTAATGPRLAEMLGVPCLSNIVAIEGQNGRWIVERETELGYEKLEVTTPFVATATNAKSNVPRIPNMKDKMWAFRQQVEILKAAELDSSATEEQDGDRLQLVRRYVPFTARECRKIEGDAAQQAVALAQYIRKIVPAAL